MTSACCGHPSGGRRARAPALPANPKVPGGTRLLFVGSGRAELRGDASGSLYHVSDHRRVFVVHPNDASGILQHPDVIQGP